jgi:hypothetical protein
MEAARFTSRLIRFLFCIHRSLQQLAHYLRRWEKWYMDHGRCHRALPLLLEAAGILKRENDCTSDLVSCFDLIGNAMRS